MDSRDAADAGRFHAAYVAERERLLARRLPFAGRVFLVSIGVVAVVDATLHPERTGVLLAIYLTQLALCGLAIHLVRRGRVRASLIGGVIAVGLAALAIVYLLHTGASVDRIGLVLVCLLSGSSLLLPWGGGVQAAVSAAICAVFLVAVSSVGGVADLKSIGFPALVVALLSFVGARYIDRYREDAFVRASFETEAACMSAALAAVGEALHVHLNDPTLFDRACGIARDAVPCDWTACYLRDEGTRRFQLRGFAGDATDLSRPEFESYEPTIDDLPLLEELARRDLVEIPNGTRQTVIPRALVERFRIASAIYAPIRHDGSVVGVLACGFTERRGAFTEAQRRLVAGVAHVTAVAVANIRLIEQLGATSRLKSEFVATMSHELRTPLSVISGYTDLLDEGSFGPVSPEQHQTLDRIRQSTITLLELVNMTLDLGRLESGREPVTPAVVSVHDLAEEIRREQQALVPIGVRHRWEYDFELRIVVDRAKVKTILKNLVGNALKFTSAGQVVVGIGWHAGVLRIDVEDTGAGIAAADLTLVFDMFRQADGSSTRRYEGVGLGLHIVKRLTELLGGTVEVQSEPGSGSTFRVRIPCPSADERLRRSA